jgi:hypothetical protein
LTVSDKKRKPFYFLKYFWQQRREIGQVELGPVRHTLERIYTLNYIKNNSSSLHAEENAWLPVAVDERTYGSGNIDRRKVLWQSKLS